VAGIGAFAGRRGLARPMMIGMGRITHSLRGRILVSAAGLTVALFGIAAYGDHLVHRTSVESHRLVETYYSSHKSLVAVKEALDEAAAAVNAGGGAVAGRPDGLRLDRAVRGMGTALGRLLADNGVAGDPRFKGIPEALADSVDRLAAAATAGRFDDGERSLDAIERLVHLMERRVYDAMVDKTVAALAASDTLSGIIWGLVVVIFVMVMATYSHFELSIRKPLLQVAEALRAEGRGVSAVVPAARTVETSLLIDAFNGMRNQVHSRQLRLQSVLDNTSDGILTFDEDGKIESVNSAAERLFGFTRDEVVGQHIGQVIPWPVRPSAEGGTAQELEMDVRRRDGTPFHLSLKLSEFTLSGRRFINALVADISERKLMIDRLTTLAERDPLTGLLNRRSFHEALEQAFARARRTPAAGFGLLSLDLDRFKYVNDTMGHQAGDRLLEDVAGVLRRRQREGDVLGRLGGDEFAVLVAGVNAAGALEAAEGFRRELADYGFCHGGKAVEIGCSIGVAVLAADCTGPDDLMARADIAVRTAKRRGRNRVHLHTQDDEDQRERRRFEAGHAEVIEQALREGGLHVLYQAVERLDSGALFAVACHPRVRRRDGGIVALDSVMPSAVRFGRAAEIDGRVIERVLTDLAGRTDCPAGVPVAVPVSAQTLASEDFAGRLGDCLRRAGVAPGALALEVDEFDAVSNLSRTRAALDALRTLGVRRALTGFGSGYASFAHLRDLTVDYVVLDPRLTGAAGRDPVTDAVVEAVTRVAAAVGCPTVALGIPSEAEAAHLRARGVVCGLGARRGGRRGSFAEAIAIGRRPDRRGDRSGGAPLVSPQPA
jgi:diguanylate cyclase (GGDEF)-like protein/PAS domain S-box-containing protein